MTYLRENVTKIGKKVGRSKIEVGIEASLGGKQKTYEIGVQVLKSPKWVLLHVHPRVGGRGRKFFGN